MRADKSKGNFFANPRTREELAQMIAERNRSVFIDMDGVARCKKCRTPKMYHEIYRFQNGDVFDGWLPIVCKCEFEEMEAKRKEECEKSGWEFEPKEYSDGSKLHVLPDSDKCPF